MPVSYSEICQTVLWIIGLRCLICGIWHSLCASGNALVNVSVDDRLGVDVAPGTIDDAVFVSV